MKKFLSIFIFLISINFISTCNADTTLGSELTGNWKFSKASFTVPAQCKDVSYNFTSAGQILTRDGILTAKLSYELKKFRQGFILKSHYISINGIKSCQGIAAYYVMETHIHNKYIEIKKNKLKIYLGLEKSSPFLVFNRAR